MVHVHMGVFGPSKHWTLDQHRLHPCDHSRVAHNRANATHVLSFQTNMVAHLETSSHIKKKCSLKCVPEDIFGDLHKLAKISALSN